MNVHATELTAKKKVDPYAVRRIFRLEELVEEQMFQLGHILPFDAGLQIYKWEVEEGSKWAALICTHCNEAARVSSEGVCAGYALRLRCTATLPRTYILGRSAMKLNIDP